MSAKVSGVQRNIIEVIAFSIFAAISLFSVTSLIGHILFVRQIEMKLKSIVFFETLVRVGTGLLIVFYGRANQEFVAIIFF